MKYVVGDIHGEISKLEQLMTHIDGDAEEFIFVGDYIDKGENSREVLKYLQNLMYNRPTTFLLGNHDFAWMEFAREGSYGQYLLQYGGRKTLADFNLTRLVKEEIQETLMQPYQDFFNSLQTHCIRQDHVVSHAGIHPESWKPRPLREMRAELAALPAEKFLYNRHNFLDIDMSNVDYYWVFGHTAFEAPYSHQRKRGVDTGAAYHADASLTAYCIDTQTAIDHRGRKQSMLVEHVPRIWGLCDVEK
jgi:serine/threonine protein phosphatase 1